MQSSALHLCFDALLVIQLVEVLGHFGVVFASPSAAWSQPGLCSGHNLCLGDDWVRAEV